VESSSETRQTRLSVGLLKWGGGIQV